MHLLNDRELADRISCASETVKNVRTERGCLNPVTLANIEYEFGPGSIDPFYALGGTRGIPREICSLTSLNAPLKLSETLHHIIATQHPASDGGVETTDAELRAILPFLRDARRSLDQLIARAETA
ncbi:hypothetical protein [Sphingomonas nostoxanthinifaciens]|uniref:hypothetical protein n=1 Tax=Sphingomonas nostoxanthinifaciens TaxID=2872652 RepID=UPI001CC21A5E|nr:hypothetical protein [Sphingomonas nostoxanthinifaciens]UAK24369.1 hypothetical protein K8P63_18985 [Sphingomonas nostoxanthinifaciens]